MMTFKEFMEGSATKNGKPIAITPWRGSWAQKEEDKKQDKKKDKK